MLRTTTQKGFIFDEFFSFSSRKFPDQAGGVTAKPPSGGGLVEDHLFSLDAVFDEVIPLAV